MRKKIQKPGIHSILFSACCFDKSLALFGIMFSYDVLKVLFPCLKLKVLQFVISQCKYFDCIFKLLSYIPWIKVCTEEGCKVSRKIQHSN